MGGWVLAFQIIWTIGLFEGLYLAFIILYFLHWYCIRSIYICYFILFYLHDPQSYGRCNWIPVVLQKLLFNYYYYYFRSHRLQPALHTHKFFSATSPTLQSRMASRSPAETPVGKPSQVYACKCLNVQIASSTQDPASSPEGTRDPAYEPIFVDDEGIAIVGFLFHKIHWYQAHLLSLSQTHPQVTVRTTTHAEPIPGTSRHSRFIVLTCLLCRLPAYRVFQTISLDIQGNESILLPTDDWVERDILKSSTGWIQVHKDGIVSNPTKSLTP